MKRSEAIKVITKAMALNDIGRICYVDPCIAPEKVLEAIEKAGMLPPSYQGCMRDGKKYIRELHGHYDTVLMRNKWEPEDET